MLPQETSKEVDLHFRDKEIKQASEDFRQHTSFNPTKLFQAVIEYKERLSQFGKREPGFFIL